MKNGWMLKALTVATAMTLAGPSFAEEKEAPKSDKPAAAQMPKPPEQVAATAKGMGGTWKCSGTVAAGPMGPEHKYEATMNWKLSPDKYWIVGTYAEKKSKDHPVPYKFTEYRTFDSKANKWVATHIADGGMLMTGTSADDKGEDWTWKSATTPMMPGDFHLVSTQKSPKETELKGEMIAPDGAKPAFTAVCKK